MTRRALIALLPALAAAVVAALLAWWLRPWGRDAEPQPAPTAGPQAVVEPAPLGAVSPEGAAAESPDAPEATVEGRPATAAESSAPPVEAVIPGLLPVSDLSLTPVRAAEPWDFAAYRRATENSETPDPNTAFLVFDYLKSCIGMPLSERDFEQRLERLNTLLERRRFGQARYERIGDSLMAGYLRCGGLDQTDLVADALEWLQLAADLGHLRAQIVFYRELPGLLDAVPGRLFREPSYLDLHRQKSVEYFERALQSGHPLAFSAYAEAILDDVLFEPDPVAAYAHLYAGDLAAAGAMAEIRDELAALERRLTAGDLRHARGWGRELCLRWCRREGG